MEENWQKKAEEYLDGWKRARADLANYKKDELKRFEEIIRFSNEELIKDLLAVLDSFELAKKVGNGSYSDNAAKGTHMIKSQFEDVLKKNGLAKVTVSAGQKFDPALHEAIEAVESAGKETGTIIEEVVAGYLLNGKLIRPARVKVAK